MLALDAAAMRCCGAFKDKNGPLSKLCAEERFEVVADTRNVSCGDIASPVGRLRGKLNEDGLFSHGFSFWFAD